jgi:hypothetical protein
MMKELASVALILSFLFIACGGESPSGDDPGVSTPDSVEVRTLSIVDSIGVELGDSNYVLGAVGSLCFGPEGNVYAFDLVRGSVLVYSPDGEFVRSISKRGEGPGEIVFPLDMTVLNDGRVMVTALGGVHQFTSLGDYQGIFAEYFQNPPMNLTAAGDSSMVASKLTVDIDEEGTPFVDFWLARLDGNGEPETIYATDRMPFDPENLTEMLQRTWMAYAIAADREGRVYLSPNSSEEFRIDVYDGTGEQVRTISLDVPMAPKTEQEIREEKEWMELHLANMGVNGVVIDYDPDPYRRMITDLGVDSQGRIWARRGTELNPVFEVFSLQGEHLFTARMPDVGDAGQFWNFAIEEEGMAAWSDNPELYQQIFILGLQ